MADRGLDVRLRQDTPFPLDVAFTCAPGQVLAIFGPSGAGKTTILRAIAGLATPREAEVRANGEAWTDTGAGVDVPVHRRRVGYVFQDHALFPHLSALGNVAAALTHLPRPERHARASALLARVHLADRASHRPSALSGGERQRVGLARALARDPAVLLLDEPFASVDRGVRQHLRQELQDLRASLDIPVLLVTHDFEDVVRLATDVLLLDRGRIVAAGPIEAVTSRADVSWPGGGFALGSVFDVVVTRASGAQALAELTFDGGALLAPGRGLEAGARVRVRVPAREVILATAPPHGLSLHNVLAGTVAATHADEDGDRVVVQVAVGGVRVLAEVTREAVTRLTLAPGRPVYALIKSLSVEIEGPAAPSRTMRV